MQIKYFESAWGDIKNSPGWFGKLCLLALVNFIPIFGSIVTFGYLYGWAREMAWGTHEPLPKSIFENEDGKFWRRGWFALVITFVFSLIPSIVVGIGSNMQTAALFAVSGSSHGAVQGSAALGGIGSLLYTVGFVANIFMMILAWIGCMRASIYNRLSAGFQFGKIWKMFRKDTTGIMKVFGMNLLVGFIVGIVLSIVISVLFFIVLMVGAASFAASGVTANQLQHMSDAQIAQFVLQMLGSVGFVGLIVLLASIFVSMLAMTFVDMLVIRALGYWTLQFDVPRWRGQDDPMPFETAQPVGQPYAYAPPSQQQGAPMGYQQQAVPQQQVTPQQQSVPQQEWAESSPQQVPVGVQSSPIIVPAPAQPLATDVLPDDQEERAIEAEAAVSSEAPVQDEPDSADEEPGASSQGE